ncbi:MAG: histidine phosphatase family protein [Acidimicrobiales bacterium]
MATIRLVRHGHAAAGFSDDHDPGLDDVGVRQAREMTATLAPLGPFPMVVSPLRRTLETARPLEQAWDVAATVDGRVAEIPSPTRDLAERGAWLSRAMAGTWADLGPELESWRDRLVQAIVSMPTDTVVVSHFIAINAVVGAAIGNDRVMHLSLANCSITTVDNAGGSLAVVDLGRTATTEVG